MTRSLLRIPLATTALLFALSFVPRIANSPGVRLAFWLACAVLLAWQLVLWLRPGPPLRVRFVPVRSHWVQALVQFSIYLYWGWVWRPVYDFMPVLLGQVVFVQHQAFGVAGAADVHAHCRITVAGQVGLRDRIAVGRAIAAPVGQVLQHGGHRVGLGVHR